MNPHDEQKITRRDEARKAREAKRASTAAFLPANDRFKQSYAALTYLCVILATLVHFALFEWFPQLQAADLGLVSEELSAIDSAGKRYETLQLTTTIVGAALAAAGAGLLLWDRLADHGMAHEPRRSARLARHRLLPTIIPRGAGVVGAVTF